MPTRNLMCMATASVCHTGHSRGLDPLRVENLSRILTLITCMRSALVLNRRFSQSMRMWMLRPQRDEEESLMKKPLTFSIRAKKEVRTRRASGTVKKQPITQQAVTSERIKKRRRVPSGPASTDQSKGQPIEAAPSKQSSTLFVTDFKSEEKTKKAKSHRWLLTLLSLLQMIFNQIYRRDAFPILPTMFMYDNFLHCWFEMPRYTFF